MTIKKVYIVEQFPPIPTRAYDYSASYDQWPDENTIQGWGATPEEAQADLEEKTQEDEE